MTGILLFFTCRQFILFCLTLSMSGSKNKIFQNKRTLFDGSNIWFPFKLHVCMFTKKERKPVEWQIKNFLQPSLPLGSANTVVNLPDYPHIVTYIKNF